MEVKLNLTNEDIPKIMKLASAGCVELLDFPELCSLTNTTWEEHYDYNSQDSFWYKGATLVHALAYKGYTEILNFPQYLKIKNECGKTPLHLLAQSFIPRYRDRNNPTEISSEVTAKLDKILEIEGLGELVAEGDNDKTPLHYIGELGYTPLLDYPGVSNIESPEWNTHGTPITLLYHYACDGLDKLLRNPSIMTDYKTHGSPLEELSRNKFLRPAVKILREYGFRMDPRWHSSKKLDSQVVQDIKSVSPSIQFIIY